LVVGGEDDPDGEIVSSTTTGISGVDTVFKERESQSILPPSLETPDTEQMAEIQNGLTFDTFYRKGTKKRSTIRTKAIGNSDILVLGEQQFSIEEKKTYADSVGNENDDSSTSTDSDNNTDDNSDSNSASDSTDIQAAEGNYTITIANGVATKTKTKG